MRGAVYQQRGEQPGWFSRVLESTRREVGISRLKAAIRGHLQFWLLRAWVTLWLQFSGRGPGECVYESGRLGRFWVGRRRKSRLGITLRRFIRQSYIGRHCRAGTARRKAVSKNSNSNSNSDW
jgi:hypothetical protein